VRQDFAAGEIAAAFHLTWLSAAGEIGYAQAVARRLPVTFAALAAGQLDPVHVRIVEDVTSILSDEDAAVADELLRLDPGAARRRKEKARRDARVRAFREQSGNAGISGRELPSVEVLASMQHVQARALRDAGVPGTWEEPRTATGPAANSPTRSAPATPPAPRRAADAGR
jgi:hypothetical protein